MCFKLLFFLFCARATNKDFLRHVIKKKLFFLGGGGGLYLEDLAAARFLAYNKLKTPKSPALGEKAMFVSKIAKTANVGSQPSRSGLRQTDEKKQKKNTQNNTK